MLPIVFLLVDFVLVLTSIALTVSLLGFIVLLLEAFADWVLATLAVRAESVRASLLLIVLALARMSLGLGVSEIAPGPVLADPLGEIPAQGAVALVVLC